MHESTPQEDSSGDDDDQVNLLSEQITLLRELIVVMVAQDRDTRHQSEKLFVMLRELRATKLMCTLRVKNHESQADQHEPSTGVNADSRSQLNA